MTTRSGYQWLAVPILALPIVLAIGNLLVTLGRPSLWLDEAWVALIVLRGQSDPTSLNTTPIGFFVLLESSTHLLGSSEFGFRFPALVFFVLAIAATAILARHMFGRLVEATMAGVLLATNFAALTYARSDKPYTADVFFAALIPVLAIALARRSTPRWWIAYGALLIIAPLFSFASLIVEASCAAFLLVALTNSGPSRRWLVSWLTTHAIAACFVAGYALVFLRSQRTDGLNAYWSSGFPPTGGLPSTLVWFAEQYARLYPWFFTTATVSPTGDRLVQLGAFILIALGVFLLARRRATYLILALGPVLLLLPTGLLHAYPFDPGLGGRLVLYILPSFCVLLAGGMGSAFRVNVPHSWRGGALAAGALVIALTLAGRGLYGLLADRDLPRVPREDLRDLITAELLPNVQSGDTIYVYYAAIDAFEYYAPEFRSDRTHNDPSLSVNQTNGVDVTYGSTHWETAYNFAPELEATLRNTQSKRVWIVVSHAWPGDEEALAASIQQCGAVGQVWRDRGAALYLYQDGAWTSADTCSSAVGLARQ